MYFIIYKEDKVEEIKIVSQGNISAKASKTTKSLKPTSQSFKVKKVEELNCAIGVANNASTNTPLTVNIIIHKSFKLTRNIIPIVPRVAGVTVNIYVESGVKDIDISGDNMYSGFIVLSGTVNLSKFTVKDAVQDKNTFGSLGAGAGLLIVNANTTEISSKTGAFTVPVPTKSNPKATLVANTASMPPAIVTIEDLEFANCLAVGGPGTGVVPGGTGGGPGSPGKNGWSYVIQGAPIESIFGVKVYPGTFGAIGPGGTAGTAGKITSSGGSASAYPGGAGGKGGAGGFGAGGGAGGSGGGGACDLKGGKGNQGGPAGKGGGTGMSKKGSEDPSDATGGNGSSSGSGASLGGAIFVMGHASFTILGGVTISGNTVKPSPQNKKIQSQSITDGNGIFLQGSNTLYFGACDLSTDSNTIESASSTPDKQILITDTICDEVGAGIGDGKWGVVCNLNANIQELVLKNTQKFSGEIKVNSGILNLNNIRCVLKNRITILNPSTLKFLPKSTSFPLSPTSLTIKTSITLTLYVNTYSIINVEDLSMHSGAYIDIKIDIPSSSFSPGTYVNILKFKNLVSSGNQDKINISQSGFKGKWITDTTYAIKLKK